MIENFTLYITDRTKVANYHDKNITHLISIRDTGSKGPYYQHFPRQPIVYKFEFDDVIDDQWHYSEGWEGPTEDHISKLIRAACEIEDLLKNGKSVNLLVHCFAGISRSTAAAYIVLCVLMGMGKEKECFEEVLRVRDCAVPNPVMAKLADILLDRKGELAKYAVAYRKYIEDSFKAKEE